MNHRKIVIVFKLARTLLTANKVNPGSLIKY